jgi:hypothetical protein
MQMSDILTGLVEFALQILLGDQQVAQSHPNVLVTEQPQPVWVHMSGAIGALGGLV